MRARISTNPREPRRTVQARLLDMTRHGRPWRNWTPFVVAVLVATALGLMTRPASTQPDDSATQGETSAAPQPASTPNPDPPGTIDGAKNPELIPDETAWRMVFLGIAEPESATEEQKARAEAKIASIGLNKQDAEAFLYLLSQFQTRLDALTAQMVDIQKRSPMMHPLSTDAEQMRELIDRTYELYADTTAALPAKLSPEGLEKLRAYMQETKRTTKIIPDM
jgi:hypothetical protein